MIGPTDLHPSLAPCFKNVQGTFDLVFEVPAYTAKGGGELKHLSCLLRYTWSVSRYFKISKTVCI
jgi:hypothetical protein